MKKVRINHSAYKILKTFFCVTDESATNGCFNQDQIIRINFYTRETCGKKLFINVVKTIAHEYLNEEIKCIDSTLINNRLVGR